MRLISAMVAAAAIAAAAGCAAPGRDAVLRTDGPRMVDLFRGVERAGGSASGDAADGGKCSWLGRLGRMCRVSERAPESASRESDLAGYTRGASNELEMLFPRLPNPDVLIYVYPHLATEARVPVPGYTTAVPLYERVEYAMPGEAVCFNGRCGDGRPVGGDIARSVELQERIGDVGETAAGEESEGDAAAPAELRVAEAGEVPAVMDVVPESGPEESEGAREEGSPVGEAEGVGRQDGSGEEEEAPALPELLRVRVERGSLRANVGRLLEEFGYRIGRWPGDADHVMDWIISRGYALEVHGLEGLLQSLSGYGLTSEVLVGESRVDFGVAK